MKEKFRYLFKNTGLMFISNFASKILVFLLVPFYTSILSTGEYGTYDLLYTTVQLLVPILSLNIIDSVMRFSIDAPKNDQKKAFTVGMKYTFGSTFLLAIVVFILAKFFKLEILINFGLQFVVLYFSYILNYVITQFSRGIEDISGIAIAGIIGTITMIFFNLLFLLFLKQGIDGYFRAMSLSLLLPVAFLIIKEKLWNYLYIPCLKLKAGKYEKEMLVYCLPLIFINLSWYINNVSDRYVVTWFCGIDTNGIYSVSYKIPAILNAVQVVFIQAWQLSAIKEYSSTDGEPFYRKTYQGCQIIMVVLCSILIMSTNILAKILFSKEFYEAWYYVPVLLLYIVFNTLSGVIGGVFSAAKDSKKLAASGIVGAISNIILNIVLVKIMGAMGAAIATVISSIIIWRMRLVASRKYLKLKINYQRHYLTYLLLFSQAACMILINSIYMKYVIQVFFLLGILLINRKEVASVLKKG
jgi:O-antigen/teichoic acid export membrane protein